jgi:tetratricopeptide (TPR) repeat protein
MTDDVRGRMPVLHEAWHATLAPPVLPPRLFRAVDPLVLRRWLGLEYERAGALRAVYEAFEPELSRFPELADAGFSLLARDRSTAERLQACRWLTLFPSDEMVDALSRVLLDDDDTTEVRGRAAWALGFRQAEERHDALFWPPELVARANDALVEAWQRGLGKTLPPLVNVSRHLDDPRLFAWMCDHLDEAPPALGAFASAELARSLLGRLEALREEDLHRILRLSAHVLGEPAAEALVAYGRDETHLQAIEALLCALPLDPGLALPPLDAAIAKMAFPGPTRAKREAYLASTSGNPHVRAVRVAWTTAAIPPSERGRACVEACLDFELLARIDAIHESSLHALWRHVAYGAREVAPERVIACVRSSPKALAELPALAEPYVVALGKAGRFREAAQVAAREGVEARAAWEAARAGRPFFALRLAGAARAPTPPAVAARALATFLAGRVDLAEAELRAFEADDEARWRAHDTADPMARAVLGGDLMGLVSLCAGAPPEADPDEVDLGLLAEAERRLHPRLEGLCVYLAGFEDRAEARASLEALGARVLDAPFGKVDLCVVPDDLPGAPIDARLVVKSVPVLPLSRALHGAPTRPARQDDGPMPQLPRPQRVILLAPVLELGDADRVTNGRIADLLGALVANFFVRHPAVAFPDTDMQHFHDGLGKNVAERQLFNRLYTEFFTNILASEFQENRRDEVFWLELALDPQKPVTTKLVVMRPGQPQPETFAAIGGPALSGMLQHCFDQWLQARQLPPTPDPFPQFSVQDFMTAARLLVQSDQGNETGGDMARFFDSFQGPLFPAFVRAGWKMMIMNDLHRRLNARALQQMPHNPPARRIDWLYRSNEGKADVAEMKQISQSAPNWSFPYMALRGKGVSDDEAMRAQMMAVFLTPGNDGAWMNLAYAFEKTTRYDDAYRIGDRMLSRDPADAGLYLSVTSFMRQTMRTGDAFREAVGRYAQMMRQSQEGTLNVQGFTQVQAGEFYVACAHADMGRLDEAIAIAERALGEDDGQRLQWQQKELKEWKTSPASVGLGYAREGFFRGDPARVLEGFGRGRPDCASDAAILVDALVALGDEKLAPFAAAHMRGAGLTTWHPLGRLAQVRGLLVGGEPLALALDSLQTAVLRDPSSKIEADVERLLRVASARPLAEWEAFIAQRRATGALRLARMAARDAADFVPGAEQSAAIRDVLGAGAPRAFDGGAVAALAASFDEVPQERLASVAAYFAERVQPTLATADKLAIEWVPTLAAEDEQGAPTRMAQMVLYFAHALGRYLTATTQAPSVLAGGYRRLATNALAAIATGSGPMRRNNVRALLQAIEAAAPGVDPWVLEPWLLRLERLWSLEAREGDLRRITDGLPIVADLLRGTEQMGLEYTRAHALKDANAAPAEACALLERSARALGKSEPFTAWSGVAVTGLPPAQALDVHWTCALANPSAAVPWVNLAKALFAAGQPDAAFEALVRAFPATGKDWRNARLAELRPLWEQARVPVPFEFGAAASASMTLMQQGQFEAALRPTRWCDSIDPNNATTKRNLGIIYARLGRAYEATLAFCQADEQNGPVHAAQALSEAKHMDAALAAYRYASIFFTTPEEWAALGSMGWQMEDDRTGAAAYEKASELSRGQLKSVQLNAWATTLLGLGQYDKARTLLEEIMRRNDDAAIAPYVLQGMAQALLGLGRAQEAVGYAQAAVQRQTPQSAQELAVTMQHAQQGTPMPLKAQPPSEAAFTALRASDAKAALEAARRVPNDARALRAALVASRYRFPTDNDTPVTRVAIEAAVSGLQTAAGTTDGQAVLAVYDAMRTCAQAFFGIDVPPPLGASVAQSAFRARFGAGAPPAGAGAPPAGDADPVVFPGQRVSKLSDYVRIMKGMQTGNAAGALAQAGLDMQSYGQVAMAWAQAMQRDPTLVQKYTRMMQS